MKTSIWVAFVSTIAVLAVGCTSDSAADQAAVGETTSSTSAVPAASEPRFSSWQEYGQWQASTMLVVDGVEFGQLGTLHECFNGECGSPMEYSLAENVVVALGAEVEVRSEPQTLLNTSWIRLGDDLRWARGPRGEAVEETAMIVFDEPGLYHVDVQADFGSLESEGTRYRHFMWLQVVDPAAPCLSGKSAHSLRITGVLDADGCPSSVAALNIISLHPEFHCNPWPASVQVTSRGGTKFLRHGFANRSPQVIEVRPVDLVALQAFIPAGEIFESPTDQDAVYVERFDGVLERWSVDDEGLLCV